MKILRLPRCTHQFTLTGFNLERFMNTMQKAEVPLLAIRRINHKTLHCECYSADLSAIARVAAEKGWRIADATPLGFSAFLARLKTRPGIPIGMLLSLIMVITLMQFVWRIEIHNAGAYQAEIAAALTEENIRLGTAKREITAAELERKLTRRYPDLAWIHVYVYNITLVVDVAQGVALPAPPSAEPTDLAATHDGIVSVIEVFAGTAKVKAGDVVRKGQVLIAGVERARDEQLAPVAARGVVMARCWRSCTIQMPLSDIESEETGRSITQTQLCTPWLRYPASLESPEFLAYNTYVENTPIVGCFFPAYRSRITQREVSMTYTPRDVAAVREEAAVAALQKLKTALYGYEIIDKWVDYCMIESETLAVTATAEWLMDIGSQALP